MKNCKRSLWITPCLTIYSPSAKKLNYPVTIFCCILFRSLVKLWNKENGFLFFWSEQPITSCSFDSKKVKSCKYSHCDETILNETAKSFNKPLQDRWAHALGFINVFEWKPPTSQNKFETLEDSVEVFLKGFSILFKIISMHCVIVLHKVEIGLKWYRLN